MKKIELRANGKYRVFELNIDENGQEIPTRTQQQHADECDVNKIIAKHKQGYPTTHIARQKGVYADLTSAPSYEAALQNIIDANNAFDTLPSEVRRRFGNDPQEFLAFLHNPKNTDEAVKLGLVDPPPPPNPTLTPNSQTPTPPTPSTPNPKS